jgi:DNA helicase-2/ATP-dependent DNA helicase PcrA
MKLAYQHGMAPTPRDQAFTIQAYFRFISEQLMGRLPSLFRNGADFFDVVSSPPFFRVLPKARESHLASAVRDVLDAPNLAKTFDVLAMKFHGLQGMIGSLDDVIDEKVPLGELYDIAVSFKGNIGDFVETMERALERARQSNAGKDDMAGVALLTYFKSKGLQWHTVILTTCNDGLIPHRKAPIEDERRLFYVAMTRASSNLLISYLKSICKNSVNPSPFLKEAGL